MACHSKMMKEGRQRYRDMERCVSNDDVLLDFLKNDS